jgi:hypothetical protein
MLCRLVTGGHRAKTILVRRDSNDSKSGVGRLSLLIHMQHGYTNSASYFSHREMDLLAQGCLVSKGEKLRSFANLTGDKDNNASPYKECFHTMFSIWGGGLKGSLGSWLQSRTTAGDGPDDCRSYVYRHDPLFQEYMGVLGDERWPSTDIRHYGRTTTCSTK